MRGGTKVREREESDTWFDLQALRKICCEARNLRQVFSRRFDIDCGIRKEIDLILNDHDVDARRTCYAPGRMMDLQRGTDHIRVIVRKTGHESICVAHLDHQRTKDIWLAQQLRNIRN